MRKPFRLLTGIASALLLIVVIPAGAAATPATPQAVTSGGVYTLANVNSTQLMDVKYASTAPGAVVLQWPANGGANQDWTLTQVGSAGAYTLGSANSGLCLEAPSTAAAAQLVQNPCSGSTAQQWQVQPVGDGTFTLANVASGLLADVNGASTTQGAAIIQWYANSGLNQHWRLTQLTRVGTWTVGVESHGPTISNQTVRMIVHTTVAGSLVRVRLSNLYGTTPLAVGAVDLAGQSSGGAAAAGTHHPVTFGGAGSATIAAGGDLTSDPIPMGVGADWNLLVSVYLPGSAAATAWHQDAHSNTYLSTAGNHVGDDSTANYPNTSGSAFFLDGLDVISPTAAGTLVAVGDSITDGVGSTWGANKRWPDDLARRMNAAPGGTTRGVVDAGIGANRVLTDADSTNPSLLTRFAHDVLGQPGVKQVILLEGINDIGNNAGTGGGALTAQQLEAGYQIVINQAHAAGVKIYGGTILPFQAAGYYTANGESIREAANQWIRTSGAFDGVVDFDAVMRSSSNSLALNPAYDTGDHLHPNDAGYQAMADAVNLGLFTP
jgi:lysophospholipase L1-like esterase